MLLLVSVLGLLTTSLPPTQGQILPGSPAAPAVRAFMASGTGSGSGVGQTGALFQGVAPTVTGATFPYGNVSIAAPLASVSVPAKSVLEVTYSFHAVSFPGGVASINFDVPQLQTSVPTGGGGSVVLDMQSTNYTMTGTGTLGGNGTMARYTFPSATNLSATSRAVMTSQLLAIQDSVRWGTVQISFRWAWALVPSGGGPALASGSSSSRTIEPQEYVEVVSDGPSSIEPGQNFTVCVGGPTMPGRTLSLHMEVPDPYYAFAWSTTHIPTNATGKWCWSVQMPTWFHDLPTPLLVHIWSYANQPGILDILHTYGGVRAVGTLRGSVLPPTASVSFEGGPIYPSHTGDFVATVDSGSGWLNASAPGYHPESRVVTVHTGGTTWANLTLVPFPGAIEGRIRPALAQITVNGTPLVLVSGQFNGSFLPGTYPVNASAAQYLPISEKVTVRPAQITWLNLSLTLAPPPPIAMYAFTARETGLPAGVGWTIILNGTVHSASSGTAIELSLPNGTYSVLVPSDGAYIATGVASELRVSGGPITWNVPFAPAAPSSPTLYSVTVSETGLPSGEGWSISVGGRTYAAMTPSSIQFPEPNGSYPITIAPITGYEAVPAAPAVVVAGGPIQVTVNFALETPPGAHPIAPSVLSPYEMALIWVAVGIAVVAVGTLVVRRLVHRRR